MELRMIELRLGFLFGIQVDEEAAAAAATDDDTPCYGGVARHLTKIRALRESSAADGAVFLNVNAGGMLGGNVWFPILGSQPAADAVQQLGYNAVVSLRHDPHYYPP